MDVREAVATRYSCRAFRPDPVSEALVRDLVERAGRAPSAGNVQPWRVDVVAGSVLEELKALLRPRMGELPHGEGGEYEVYPRDLADEYRNRRFEVGELLYKSIGIPREDKPARYRQFARNFEFFGAPVGVFVSTQRSFAVGQWIDLGIYIQTLMLLARDEGLHTCPQEAWGLFSKTVGAFLKLPAETMLFCGIALGYADETAPINSWRAPRAPVENWASFRGFEK